MSPRHQPPSPSEVAIRSERSAYAEAIPPGDVTAACRGPVLICAEYDDRWRTPVTMAPLRVTDRDGVVLDGTARTQGLPSFGMQDGDEIDDVRPELGRFDVNDAARGPVTVELVPDPSAASEVDALSQQIKSVLNGFKSEMETALLPWITEWNEKGILSIPRAYRSGQIRGLSEWWEGEKDFWASVGGWISNAFKAAVNATVQAAQDLKAWYDDLPWYGKISPLGYWLVQQIGDLFESAVELWERREQIMALVKAFAEGAINGIETALEALKDLPGEVGELITLLVDKSAEWVGALIEMIRETDVVEELFTSMIGIVMMMPPNLWAEALGTVEGYLLPEVLLAIVFAVIAALSAGAGSAALAARLATFVTKVRAALVALGKIGPLLLKIFGKLDEIGQLIVRLVRALKRKIEETVKSATDTLTRLIRSTQKIDQRLIGELAERGVKHTPDDIVAIRKLDDGRIMFIEKGSDTAGLQHILNHADEFNGKGISNEMIPDFIMKNLEEGNIVGYQGKGTGRPIYEIIYNGQRHRTAITTGNNGFVVGANPVSLN